MGNKLSIKYKVAKPMPRSVGPSKRTSHVQSRDQTQSRRLHEPTSIASHTDPITGHDVLGAVGQPFVKDGILTVCFESGVTRAIHLNTP